MACLRRYTVVTKRIVISGFGPQYGAPNAVAPGDTVHIFVQNTMGPEFTIWDGTLPAM